MIRNIFWSTKKDKIITISVLSLVVALLIFKAGMFIGYHRALFSYRSDARFSSDMGQGRDMMKAPPFGFMREEFPTNHGAAGRIVSVSLPHFVVAGLDNSEKTVTIGKETMIRRMRDTVASTSIKVDENAVVLGEPDDTGKIQAKFIRLMSLPR